MGTDAEWRKWAKADPYYAVLSTPEYREGAEKEKFLASGKRHFNDIVQRFHDLHLTLDQNGAAVDFGCGVGRVLAPISRYFTRAVGIDISESMLDEAKGNVDPQAELRLLKDNHLEVCLHEPPFEFIHSSLVFQHIPPQRGFRLLAGLCDSLATGGKMAIELPIAARYPVRYRLSQALKANALLCKLGRFLLRRPNAFEPIMQMHIYPLTRLLALWQEHGLEARFLAQRPDGDIWQGAWYLYKTSNPGDADDHGQATT